MGKGMWGGRVDGVAVWVLTQFCINVRGTLVGGCEEADEDARELGVLGGGSSVLDEGASTRVSGRREAEWLGGSRSCVRKGVRLVAGSGWAASRECCSA